jgi:hypothetical protein
MMLGISKEKAHIEREEQTISPHFALNSSPIDCTNNVIPVPRLFVYKLIGIIPIEEFAIFSRLAHKATMQFPFLIHSKNPTRKTLIRPRRS